MTAIGFAVFCICCMIFKSQDDFYWNQHKRRLEILEGFVMIGLLLIVAGLSVFFWRILP